MFEELNRVLTEQELINAEAEIQKNGVQRSIKSSIASWNIGLCQKSAMLSLRSVSAL